MFRPRVTSIALAAGMAVAGLTLGACSSPHANEENLVRQYFRASGLRDNMTLANFAVVSFDPKKEGTVSDFEIVSVSEERVEPLQIIPLAAAVTEAEAANKAFTERKKEYQDAHMAAIDRVLAAQKSGKKLSGADGAVQAEWEKWQSDTAAEAKKVSAARVALSDSRPIAEISLVGANADAPPVAEMDGTLATKDVTINAQVKAPDGTITPKTMVLTMKRVTVKSAKGDRNGKWIITSIKSA
jgi:hypothetical protein